jgi:tetratricopeptide (TPR) repeat protein
LQYSFAMVEGSNTVLAALHLAWAEAARGRAQVLLLEGAAGLGKSHALRGFASSVQSGLVLSCSSHGWLAQALRLSFAALESERDPVFLEAARRLVPELPWARVAQVVVLPDQLTLWNAVALAFERLAHRLGGLVLLLEDAHEVSASDLAGVRALYRRALLGQAPMLLIISSRPTESDLLAGFMQDSVLLENSVAPQRLVLSRLNQLEVHGLLESHLHSAAFPEGLSTWLMARAEGHPLYTLLLLRFLQDGGALKDLGVTWVFEPPKGKGIPPNLEAVLQARIANAKRDLRLWSVLCGISVLDRQVSLADLSKITVTPAFDLLEITTRLEYLGLLREGLSLGQTVFGVAHPLFSPLVRAQLGAAELEKLHLKIVDVVTSNTEKASHARAANHPKAIEWSGLALHQAKASYDHEQVIRQAQFLLSHKPGIAIRLAYLESLRELGKFDLMLEETQNDDSPEAALHRIYALDFVGKPQEAFELAQNGFLKYPEPIRSRIGFHLARLQVNRGHFIQAEEILQTLVAQDAIDQTLLLFEWNRFYYYQDQPKKVLEVLEQAEIWARQCPPRYLMLILSKKSAALANTQNHEQAAPLMQEALELARELGMVARLAEMHNDFGLIYLSQGSYPKASQMFAQGLRYAQATQDGLQIAHAYYIASAAEFAMLKSVSGRAYTARSIEFFEKINKPIQVGNAKFFQAWTESTLGNVAAVKAFFASDLALEPDKLYSWHLQAAEMNLNIGEFSAALKILSEAPISSYPLDRLADHHHRLALVYLGLEQFQAALEHNLISLEHSASLGNPCQKAEMVLTKAIIYWYLQQADLVQAEAKEALGLLHNQQAGGHLIVLQRLFPKAMQYFQEPQVQPETQATNSYLRTFGIFGLEQDGIATPWRASKVRDLLAVLLIAYLSEEGPSISKAQLIDAVWQNESPESSDGKFRVSIKRLREALGDAATIYNQYGRYELQNLKADVVFFLTALERLDFEAAIGWYKGSFLKNIDLPNAEIIRAQLWQNFRDTALKTSFETPNANLLEKLHHLEPLDIGILERYLEVIADDAFRTAQTLDRAKQTFEREIGEIPIEIRHDLTAAASAT